jgi:hypothetical protein
MKIEVFSVNTQWGEGNSDAGFDPLQGTMAEAGMSIYLSILHGLTPRRCDVALQLLPDGALDRAGR